MSGESVQPTEHFEQVNKHGYASDTKLHGDGYNTAYDCGDAVCEEAG